MFIYTTGSNTRRVYWDISQRAAVGETILHLCFLNATRVHYDIAKMIIMKYPPLVDDIYISDEFYGKTSGVIIFYDIHFVMFEKIMDRTFCTCLFIEKYIIANSDFVFNLLKKHANFISLIRILTNFFQIAPFCAIILVNVTCTFHRNKMLTWKFSETVPDWSLGCNLVSSKIKRIHVGLTIPTKEVHCTVHCTCTVYSWSWSLD